MLYFEIYLLNTLKLWVTWQTFQHYPAVWPSNLQFCNHVNEFLFFGYRASIGNVEVRFPKRDPTRVIEAGTVGITDGQTKILLMAGIVGILIELELEDHPEVKDPESTISKTLKSFAAIRCSFTDFSNPSHHFLHSLRRLVNAIQILFLHPFVFWQIMWLWLFSFLALRSSKKPLLWALKKYHRVQLGFLLTYRKLLSWRRRCLGESLHCAMCLPEWSVTTTALLSTKSIA